METLNEILFSLPLRGETVFLRLILATLLSGLIGLERGRRGRAAGMRTYILVCLGAALTALTGVYACYNLKFPGSDPLRICAQVVSGIGFLGVGTILVRGKSIVTGLTTAAGLWATAAVGIAVGVGFYSAGIACTVIIMFVFAFFTAFERSGKGGKYNAKLYIECTDAGRVNELVEAMTSENTRLCEIEVTPSRSGHIDHIGIEATLILGKRSNREDEIKKIADMEYVLFAIESV